MILSLVFSATLLTAQAQTPPRTLGAASCNTMAQIVGGWQETRAVARTSGYLETNATEGAIDRRIERVAAWMRARRLEPRPAEASDGVLYETRPPQVLAEFERRCFSAR